ncbi:DUF4139 domain-containing protein, partial [Providencia rettgeri]|nr:DUF4139 domain-containing protein [Providencia rettgeri]
MKKPVLWRVFFFLFFFFFFFFFFYFSPDAAWSPSYDIRSQDVESPITLTYKANLIQNTGIDWEKVNLT